MQKIMRLNRTDFFDLAKLYWERGRSVEALDLLEESLKFDTKRSKHRAYTYCLKSRIYITEGRLHKSMLAYGESCRTWPRITCYYPAPYREAEPPQRKESNTTYIF